MSWLDSVFGSKPQVAMYKPLKLPAEQQAAIGADIAAMPQIEQLGAQYQQYLTQQMESLIPGYSDILKQGGADTAATLAAAEPLLKGQIPQDVQDAIQRGTAYQSLSGGFAGSGMARSLTARDLGLTSLDLISQGANLATTGGNAAQRWANLARGETLNPASFYVSPMEQANFDTQQRVLRQQSLQNLYNVQAAPDPAAKGVSDTLISLIGAYLGHGMGGTQTQNPYSSTFGTTTSSLDSGDPYNMGAYPGYGGGIA